MMLPLDNMSLGSVKYVVAHTQIYFFFAKIRAW